MPGAERGAAPCPPVDRGILAMLTMMAVPAGGWNHNTHYHDRLLVKLPRPCRRALDVGCGFGTFARRLSTLADEVDAIDRDPAAVQQARADSADILNIRFVETDFMT